MPVTFSNNELRTNPAFFAAATEQCTLISWAQGISANKQISPGTTLATIQWGDGSSTDLVAPASCGGTIKLVNQTIAYEDLELVSVLLLVLS